MNNRTVKIGAGCSADVTLAIPQMARYGQIDYMVIDYMMEHGVAKMAAARDADPNAGFGAGFLGPEVLGELPRILGNKIKIITNAGGLNPFICAQRLEVLAHEIGLNPKIAVVHGDEVITLAGPKYREMYTGHPLPAVLSSANAYLGAKPIAVALDKGADIVVTGRVVDSALSLGPLLHEFDWALDDYDLLAAGSIVGHLLECGAQPSGGIHTDWREIDFASSSFPIAEVDADGSVIITKVPGTGGKISFGTIAEQLVYEIGDPQRYTLPDLTLDFSNVKLTEEGPDRIRLSGARGYPPTSTYKVCCIEPTGWRSVVSTVISGKDAVEKAAKNAEAIIKRSSNILREHNWGDFESTSYELIGSGKSLGAHTSASPASEIVYRVVTDHAMRQAAEVMPRVSNAAGPSMSPGTSATLGSEVRQKMKLWSFLLDKTEAVPKVTIAGDTVEVPVPLLGGFRDELVVRNDPFSTSVAEGDAIPVPLERLAFARSGDKGNIANVGVIARHQDFAPFIFSALTVDVVKAWYRHVFANYDTATVQRFELPGIGALNFLLHDALDGGAVTSRRFDDMGKALGQQILGLTVSIPATLTTRHRLTQV